MSHTFAFLRAVNVGGHTVTMAQLKELFEGVGLKNVDTFIASGNVIFDHIDEQEASLQRRIASHLHGALGYEVVTFLRTERELAALVAACPFTPDEITSAQALNVALLQAPLSAEGEARLQLLESDVDAFRVVGRDVWWLCSVKQSESSFSNAVFEKALKVKATFRGSNTLKRLAAKYGKA